VTIEENPYPIAPLMIEAPKETIASQMLDRTRLMTSMGGRGGCVWVLTGIDSPQIECQ
jgi:hypothetical protein